MKPLTSIFIVGGDRVSWMVASTLAQCLPGVAISLLDTGAEADSYMTDSLNGDQQALFASLGLSWQEVLVHARGTYKLANSYTKQASAAYHGLGEFGPSVELLEANQLLARLRSLGAQRNPVQFAPELERCSVNAWAARKGRFAFPEEQVEGLPLAWGIHFNAEIFTHFMRQRTQALGVRIIPQDLAKVALDEAGSIGFVTSADGTEWRADLYIDCSGSTSRVSGQALDVGFESWERWLPYDSCLVASHPHVTPFHPVTEFQQLALTSGNVCLKRTPLRDHMALELYYTQTELSDIAAAELLANHAPQTTAGSFKHVKIQPGRRSHIWQKNCIAMGGAAVDLGNLGYSSTFTTLRALVRLLEFLPAQEGNERLSAEYNRVLGDELDNLRDGQLLQQLWLDDVDLPAQVHLANLPPTLDYKLSVYFATGRYVFGENELISKEQWLSLLMTLDFWPEHTDLLAEAYSGAQLQQLYLAYVAAVEQQVAKLPQHLYHLANFLKKTKSH